jgi:GWxTD domain-containing protein
VRDEGSTRSTSSETSLNVPRLETHALSSPITVYEATPRASADSAPSLIANPRATAVLGRDSVMQVYLEGYGLAPDALVVLTASGEGAEALLWRDTVTLTRNGSLNAAVVSLPVSRIGVGRITLAANVAGSTDTVRSPVFVSFGGSLVVSSFDEMLSYLRYFASPERLRVLQEATLEARGRAWMTFWNETDPVPSTAEHEGLRDYFQRLTLANERFREEGGPGWLTDRGRVFVSLGDPDQIYERADSQLRQRGRAQIWVYNQHQAQLAFIDRTGFGQWRLSQASEAEFLAALRRLRAEERAARR